MPSSTLDVCQEYYGTRDVYELFGIDKKATDQEVKKAYYRLSLKTHPDRVPVEDKETATERFKVLSKIYSVLSDKDKRTLYDERGIIDDDDDGGNGNWLAMWAKFFKPITEEDISNFERDYIDSELERNDIKKAYVNGKGCINYMLQTVPFMSCESEPRIAEIVQRMIDAGEVPNHAAFTNEPKAKRTRRHKKYAREAREAAQLKEENRRKNVQRKAKNNDKEDDDGMGELEKQIAMRGADRQRGFASLLQSLEEKYCGGENGLMDDDEEFVPDDEDDEEDVRPKVKKPKQRKSSSNGKNKASTATSSGRISARKTRASK